MPALSACWHTSPTTITPAIITSATEFISHISKNPTFAHTSSTGGCSCYCNFNQFFFMCRQHVADATATTTTSLHAQGDVVAMQPQRDTQKIQRNKTVKELGHHNSKFSSNSGDQTFSLMNENSPGWNLLNQDPYQWKCSQVLPKYTVS